MQKILFVITQPVVGGSQKYVFDLAARFSENYAVSVAIGGPKNGDLFKKLAEKSIETHFLKFLVRDIKPLDDVLAFFELLKLFKKERPDVIHLNGSKAGLVGAAAGFFAGVGKTRKPKIIFTAHGWVFKEDTSALKKRFMIALEWFASKFRDRIICVSRDDFGQALRYRIAPPRKLNVIHNAEDKIEFLSKNEARAEIAKLIGREIPEDAVALVNMGRLYATKGLNYLIEAVSHLETSFPSRKIVLVIFGDGPEREALKLQITNYKLQEFVFLIGDVSDASKYLPAFDALVLSSVKEGLPYSILEAGLAGIPVISTNVGGAGEIIKDGENGILIESKNSQAIADAVRSIINDNDKAKKLSAKLKKSITEDFSFDEMIERTEWVYKV